MIKKIRRINNNSDSLFITIPKYIVGELKLEPNQDVDIKFVGTKIIIDTKVEE